MFIEKYHCISPAGVLTSDNSLQDIVQPTANPLLAKEPVYTQWIPPMQLRRMSKPVRMGVTAARLLVENAEVKIGAINVATAYGLLQDSEVFLEKLLDQNEQMLNPTAFIQSTHNTVAGSIALSLSCSEHNLTYVHCGHSFENALTDIVLIGKEKENHKFILGGTDECTPSFFRILQHFGIYKSDENDDAPIAGEGAVFFLLSHDKENALASIDDFISWKSEDEAIVLAKIRSFLQKHNAGKDDQDIFISGNADTIASNRIYNTIQQEYFRENRTVVYKKYSGEYPTAVSFGVAMAVAQLVGEDKQRAILINNYGKYWSAYVLVR